eukprot:4922880-Pyramimonas_sp.AAC.1
MLHPDVAYIYKECPECLPQYCAVVKREQVNTREKAMDTLSFRLKQHFVTGSNHKMSHDAADGFDRSIKVCYCKRDWTEIPPENAWVDKPPVPPPPPPKPADQAAERHVKSRSRSASKTASPSRSRSRDSSKK